MIFFYNETQYGTQYEYKNYINNHDEFTIYSLSDDRNIFQKMTQYHMLKLFGLI